MNPICFYHKSDLDGVCSAAIVKHFVPDCELYGIDYQDEFPWACLLPQGACPDIIGGPPNVLLFELASLLRGKQCKPRTVYMVDFSLKPDDMRCLAKVSDLIWIDHHKTAIDALCIPNGPEFHRYHCLTTKAACELCWEFFEGSPESTPEAIRLLGAYDSWRKNDPGWDSRVLPFQYGMRQQGPDLWLPESLFWKGVVSPGIWSIKDVQVRVEWGAMVLRYQAEQDCRALNGGARFQVLKVHIPGQLGNAPYPYRVLACNTHVFNSQFFVSQWDPEKYDLMCAYAQLKDGRWKVSIYSTKADVDCGYIAKQFGGGGHKGAAGYVCDKLPWGQSNEETK